MPTSCLRHKAAFRPFGGFCHSTCRLKYCAWVSEYVYSVKVLCLGVAPCAAWVLQPSGSMALAIPRRRMDHTIPYHTIPYHTMPYHTIPCRAMPCYVVPYHTIPYHTIPYHGVCARSELNVRFCTNSGFQDSTKS